MKFDGFCLLFLKNTQLGHDVSGCYPEYYFEDHRNGEILFLPLLKWSRKALCSLSVFSKTIRLEFDVAGCDREHYLEYCIKSAVFFLPILKEWCYHDFMFSISHIFCLFSNRIQQGWCLSLHPELCIYCKDLVCPPILKTLSPQHHVLCGGVNFPPKFTSLQLILFSKSLKNDAKWPYVLLKITSRRCMFLFCQSCRAALYILSQTSCQYGYGDFSSFLEFKDIDCPLMWLSQSLYIAKFSFSLSLFPWMIARALQHFLL